MTTIVALVLSVIAVLVAEGHSLQAEQCVYKPNTNITSEDMVPAAFSVSTYDCCATCWKTKGCVAAVYSNYMCHLKGVALPTAASSTATAVFAELPSTPVPPTPQPTTPAPPPPPPSTTPSPQPTTTPSPPTTSPPSGPEPPITPSPNSTNGSVILYRSMMCSPLTDACYRDRCVTKIYISGECYDQNRYTCLPNSKLQKQWYAAPQCEGTIVANEGPTNTCAENYNNQLEGSFCDYATPAESGLQLVMNDCGEYVCGAPQCNPRTYITGRCVKGDYGNSTIYDCWPDAAHADPSYGAPGYITISSFSTSNCSGTPSITALPLGVCYKDPNDQMHMNTCGKL